MRFLILALLLALGVSTPAAVVPIKNGLLQSALNGNGQNITNVGSITDVLGNPIGATTNTTNFAVISVTSAINLGVGAATTSMTSSNGLAFDGFVAPVWNFYTDFNTNTIWGTNASTAVRNGPYSFTSVLNGYTNGTGIFISNWNGAIFTLHVNTGSPVSWSNGVGLFSPNWINVVAGTNLFFSTVFRTNATWGFECFGPLTNNLGLSNGMSMTAVSNGVFGVFTSRRGGTNQAWNPIAVEP